LILGGGPPAALPDCYAGFEQVPIDTDPDRGADITLDLRGLQRLEPAQADAVFCAHGLERCAAHEVPRVLAGMLHLLKPDGFADIRVHDLGAILAETVRRGLDIEDTLYTAPAGPVTVRDVIFGYGPAIARPGGERHAHRTGFTQKSLARALVVAGFGYVLRRPGRALELSVLAFREAPTEAQKRLLDLRPPINLLLR
jgi:hypothetical protein